MEGCVNLGGWLHTEIVYLHAVADGHTSNSNRARRRVTTLIEANTLLQSLANTIQF